MENGPGLQMYSLLKIGIFQFTRGYTSLWYINQTLFFASLLLPLRCCCHHHYSCIQLSTSSVSVVPLIFEKQKEIGCVWPIGSMYGKFTVPIFTRPASSKGRCLNPRGWCIGTPYYLFSTLWKIQVYTFRWFLLVNVGKYTIVPWIWHGWVTSHDCSERWRIGSERCSEGIFERNLEQTCCFCMGYVPIHYVYHQ